MKPIKRVPEFIRFVMVGILATALHYGAYFLLQTLLDVNIAYTLATPSVSSPISTLPPTSHSVESRHGEKHSVSAEPI